MSPIPLVRRIEVLEDQVSTLTQLPERVASLEGALSAFRTEVLGELAGAQGTLAAIDSRLAAVEGKLETADGRLAAVEAKLETVDGRLAAVEAKLETVDGRLAAVDARLATVDGEFAAVRKEIRDGDEETRRQMRVLHEEVISRIALLQEGLDARARGKRRKK